MAEAIIDIIRIGARGQGVGFDGERNIYFVERTLPGDKALVEFKADAKRYRDAELREVVFHSPDRVQPVCQYFQQCGGCDWLNWSYEAQLNAKDAMVSHALSRPNVKVRKRHPIHGASQKLGYRTRVQLRFEGKKLGFYRRGSHDLVDVERCEVAHPLINEAMANIRQSLTEESGKVEIVVGNEPMVGQKAEAMNQPTTKVYVEWNKNHAASGFTQINSEQNEYLKKRVASLCSSHSVVLELFCGDGNLTSQFAPSVVETIAVDSSAPAIERARALLPSDSVSFFKDEINNGLLKRLPHDFLTRCNLLLLNPPRQGLMTDMSYLIPTRVKRIIYVSCSPAELAEDAVKLKSLGFGLSELECIDMFPQTRHIESLAVFEKNLID